jgi:hypothetical protein
LNLLQNGSQLAKLESEEADVYLGVPRTGYHNEGRKGLMTIMNDMRYPG